MSKLLKLKEWLTLADAARHLSIMFEEEVSEADVLQLALLGQLRLSLNLVNFAVGKPARIVPLEDADLNVTRRGCPHLRPQMQGLQLHELKSLPDEIKRGVEGGLLDILPDGEVLEDERILQCQDSVWRLDGVMDLPMVAQRSSTSAKSFSAV